MAWQVEWNAPFLYFNAASVADHEQRLSGPSPSPPTSDHGNGTEEWRGPYGTPVDQWTDATHPPGAGISYTAPTSPNVSWYFNSVLPDGWYTVILEKL